MYAVTKFFRSRGRNAASRRRALDLAKSGTKLALKIVKEVSEALPPLKSVAAGLTVIIENAEVRDFSSVHVIALE